MAFYRKRKPRGGFKMRKRYRRSGSFRPGSGRRLRSTRFSRRSYAPGLMPESKYADAAYGAFFTNNNVIQAPAGASSLILDANGPATTNADQNAGGNPPTAGIINGAAFNQRIGRKVFLKYMSVRMRFYWLQALSGPTASTTPLTQRVRAMLFYDRQPNLSLPVVTDVMNVNPGLTVDTFQEDRNRDRFVRLFDHTQCMTLNTAAPAANDSSIASVNKVIKIRGIQVYNDSGLGTVTSIQTGSLFWLFMWDAGGTGTTAGSPPVVDLVSRLRYSDL